MQALSRLTALVFVVVVVLLQSAFSADAFFHHHMNPFKVAGTVAKANMKMTEAAMKMAPKVAKANMKMTEAAAKMAPKVMEANVKMTEEAAKMAPVMMNASMKMAEAQMKMSQKMTDAMLHPDRLLLGSLNAAKSKINDGFRQNTPDVIPLDGVGMQGNSSTGCLLRNPFGGCLCKAGVDYSVSLANVTGARNTQVVNFTKAHTTPSGLNSFHATIEAFVAANKLVTRGDATAKVSACHLDKSAEGKSSAQVDTLLRVTISASATIDMFKQCVNMEIKKMDMAVEDFNLSNVHVELKLMSMPWIKLDQLNELVGRLEPVIKDKLLSAMQESFGNQVPSFFYENEQPKCMSLMSFL